MSLSASETYLYYGQQIRQWMPILPWIVTLGLFVLSINPDHHGYWKKNFFLVLYGFYLHIWQYVLVVFQLVFHSARTDPFTDHIYVVPLFSQEAFYLWALVTIFVMYSFFWRQAISPLWWTFVWFVVAFPAVFVWFGYAFWYEVLFGGAMGVISTAGYVLVFRIYLLDSVPYLICQTPWTWLSCNGGWCLTRDERDFARCLPDRIARCERIIAARAARHGQRPSLLRWDALL